MANHGKIGQFNPSIKAWSSYVERLHYYFLANGVTEAAKKHSILLTVCGAPTFQLLRSLVQPKELSAVTYTELLAVLESHYDPAPLTIVQLYRFQTRNRQPGESVATFVAELKAIGRYCKFRNSLNEMILATLVNSCLSWEALMLILFISPTVSLSQQSSLKERVQIFSEEIGCL